MPGSQMSVAGQSALVVQDPLIEASMLVSLYAHCRAPPLSLLTTELHAPTGAPHAKARTTAHRAAVDSVR
jgi:hypothetical protein